MKYTAEELEAALTGYADYDEVEKAEVTWHGRKDYDEPSGKFWDDIAYADANEVSVYVEGFGTFYPVENGFYLDSDDTIRYFVFKSEDNRFFKMTGWYDSWNGDGAWDGKLVEVHQVSKTIMEWQRV